ncbi:hypothetical protein HMPREF1422_01584 [Helicobacter pylori GAM268Bii]|uniref:Uncharacterized protein n=1 Tax=Helicobacter pylori HP260AFii TaxID=1159077 RepID=A0ABC9S7J2_HELPX|nr:hypothetical protein HMPREF1422_01584 [Helicobacter pylori GAM268Bii]EMH64580.1 hypothetical protein HMPREF1449_01568 [Helicobacter pylori HP260AFii]
MHEKSNTLRTLKLCKIPNHRNQSESQTLPQYQPKKAYVFSVWALHYS